MLRKSQAPLKGYIGDNKKADIHYRFFILSIIYKPRSGGVIYIEHKRRFGSSNLTCEKIFSIIYIGEISKYILYINKKVGQISKTYILKFIYYI